MRIAILSDTDMPRGRRGLPVERLRDADLTAAPHDGVAEVVGGRVRFHLVFLD